MEMFRRYFDTAMKSLGPNEVEVIAGTSNLARDGHVVDMAGLDMRAFMRSGTILFQHDPAVPVGIPSGGRVDSGGALRLGITFAPQGDSDDADKIRRLVKSGMIRNLSIGFNPLVSEPLDPTKPRAGQRIVRSELLEVSFVSVPADTGAVVTARALSDLCGARLEQEKRRREVEMLALRWPPEALVSNEQMRRRRQVEVLRLAAAR
jgi:HK97 family phage prohead protease